MTRHVFIVYDARMSCFTARFDFCQYLDNPEESMRLLVMSDLHIEFRTLGPELLPKPDAYDIAVLAGDIHVKGRSSDWANAHFTKPVIAVAGNHEHYGLSIQKSYRRLTERAAENVRFLERQVAVHKQVRYLGCTAWADFAAHGNPVRDASHAQQSMNDYQCIRVEPHYRKLRAIDTHVLAIKSKQWLLNELCKPFDGKTVVVTHHAPLKRFLPKHLCETGLSAAYANEWTEFLNLKIDLWVFGHTHHSVDETVCGIRFVSNPRGYPGENPKFDSKLIVTI